MSGQHVGMAEQLGMFFPKVASAARAQKIEEVKKAKNERAEKAKKGNGKVAQKADQAKAVVVPAPAPTKKAVSSDGVVSRELLWAEDGKALFSVYIPRDAEYKVGVNGGDDYLRFFRPVKGGVVNIHVYHPDNHPGQFAGEKVVCGATVWMKRYEDGREYLYLNLFIFPRETEAGRLPSHEWRVVQGRDPFMPKGMKNVHHFPTPEPLDGAVVVGERILKFQ
mgnify:CR=1 FL=1